MEQINEVLEVSTYLPGRYGPLFVPWTHYAKGTPVDNSSAVCYIHRLVGI